LNRQPANYKKNCGLAILQFEKIGRGHGLRLEKFEIGCHSYFPAKNPNTKAANLNTPWISQFDFGFLQKLA
jgi:hypothetical protein